MANPKLLFSDVSAWALSASYAVSGSNALTNLNDYEPNTIWESSRNNINQTLQIDLGESTAVSHIIVDNHNWYDVLTSNASVDISGSTASNFSTLAYKKTYAYATVGDSSTWYVALDSGGATARYWRFNFKATPTWESGLAPHAGTIYIGTPLEFTYPYDYGYKKENASYMTSEKVALDGTIKSSQVYAGRIVYELKFSLQADALKTAFQTFVRSVRGKMYPFFFIDTDGTTVYYMHFVDDYVPVSVRRYGQNDIASIKMVTHEADY